MERFILVLFGVVVFIVFSCHQEPKSEAQDSTSGPPLGRNWKLIWNDEFDGTNLDMGKWNVKTPNLQGSELKYKNSMENIGLDGNGNLIITLTRDEDGTIKSNGGIYSNFTKAFGYFEARVKFSTQPGWWTSFWLSGQPYGEGDDTFLYPQEFDIYEDFYKPKETKGYDIHQSYWANYGKPNFETKEMISTNEINKILKQNSVLLNNIKNYTEWHTVALEWTPLEHIFYLDSKETYRMSYNDVPVTNVPLRIILSANIRNLKKTGNSIPFHGWLEDATFPDKFSVDYVRAYVEDFGAKTAPEVTLTMPDGITNIKKGDKVSFTVTANDKDGTVKTIYLFSKGRIRAERNMDSRQAEYTFIIDNLFAGDNTIIAMAKDNDGRVGISKAVKVTVK
jgi:beta-glucanase (GH16 family)